MISLENGGKLVESVSELPNLFKTRELFLDLETVSGDPKRGGTYAYRGDRICGIAVTADDAESSWYVPIRHLGPAGKKRNLPIEPVLEWARSMLGSTKRWVNHNTKFDAHFLHKDGVELTHDAEMVDTLTMSKMMDSDRLGFGLKDLCREWLELPMEEEVRKDAWLKSAKTKDFGEIPPDILAEYACQDAMAVRKLWHHVQANRPEGLDRVWETEIKLTPTLYDIEKIGLIPNLQNTKVQKLISLRKMIANAEEITNLTGVEFSDSNACVYEILIAQLGLPVLAHTKTGGPSFDHDSLILYAGHPRVLADEKTSRVVSAIMEYRTEETFKGLFCDTLIELSDSRGIIHPSYNQMVRTGGRMSCKEPNSQQFNKRAKGLIIPGEGYGFLSWDASQIEFRFITHVVQDADAIKAFNTDNKTDFHQWVAQICEFDRDSAKTMNFSMAFGAGKKKVKAQIMANEAIVKLVGREVDEMIEKGVIESSQRAMAYARICEARADMVFNTYHGRMPGIKRVANDMQEICAKRGYIMNAFGRRRHLPVNQSRKAFNTYCQGSAGDFVKSRMVELAPRYCKWTRDLDLQIVAQVHDELLFRGPIEVISDPAVHARLKEVLETSPISLRVPLLWEMGMSTKSWEDAVLDAKRRKKAA